MGRLTYLLIGVAGFIALGHKVLFFQAVGIDFCTPCAFFPPFLKIIKGADQIREHLRRGEEEGLGLRFRNSTNFVAQMLNKLLHLGFDFLRGVNHILIRNEGHAMDVFLKGWFCTSD
jgi:hypothetical protein